ncbi:hypothetical protein KIP58_21615, partial [Xanthomonas campestris pv. campestris]
MGLFSSKKLTYVSSVAYNMAGAEEERPSYIKSLVLKNITSDTQDSLATTLRYGYLGGPQMDFRSFYRWTRDNYPSVGLPSAEINGFENINNAVVTSQLPAVPGWVPYLQLAEPIGADYTAWAEQYIMTNRPEEFTKAWKAFMLDSGQIYIEYSDGATALFTPSEFFKDATYLYILYSYIKENITEPTVTGPVVVLSSGQPYPSTSGWTVDYDNNTVPSVTLHTVTTTEVSYSDGSPTEETTEDVEHTETYAHRSSHFTRTEYIGQDPESSNARLINRRYDLYFMTTPQVTQTTEVTETSEENEGVTITTKITVVTDVLTAIRSHRTDTTDTIVSEWSGQHIWLYRIGSGYNSALENMIANPVRIEGEFYAPMPIRIENRFIANDYYTDVYQQTGKGYKKLLKQSFDDLIAKVADNPNLGDIDFAFLVFGVSLNVKENACKKYLYRFFKKLMNTQQYGPTRMEQYIQQMADYNQWMEDLAMYYAGVIPEYPGFESMINLLTNEVQIKTTGTSNIPYDIRISWVSMEEYVVAGRGKPDAVNGEVWFQQLPNRVWERAYFAGDGPNSPGGLAIEYGDHTEMEHLRIYWQDKTDSYRYIDIYGLKHINYVYNGKYVEITANEALNDPEESG